MYKIKEEYITEIEIKKSKFITYLKRIESENDAKEYILAIKKLHPNATHHCYAFIVGEIQRSNDDGEPANTAGIPILKELHAFELTDVICVVVRYFRGIKLGVGGLIRAYSSSAKSCLSIIVKYELIEIQKQMIYFEYSYIDKIEYLLHNTTIISKNYEEEVIYTFLSNDDFQADLSEISAGKIKVIYLEKEKLEVAIKNTDV